MRVSTSRNKITTTENHFIFDWKLAKKLKIPCERTAKIRAHTSICFEMQLQMKIPQSPAQNVWIMSEEKIRCKNNKKKLNIPIGSTLSDAYRELNLNIPYGPVSAKVNNKVEGLNYRLYHNKDIEFLGLDSASGMRAYTRSLFFVLCKAVNDLYPEGKVVIDIPVSNGYYCDLRIGREIADKDVEAIRKRMEEIVKAAIPIRRHEAPAEDAIRMFEEMGAESKVSLLKSIGNLYTTYYTIDDYKDYYYGTMLTNTSQLSVFGLEKYYDGMLLRTPTRQNPNELGALIRQDKMFEIFKEHHRWQQILGIDTVGVFNQAVMKGWTNDIVNISEALQEKKIAKMADEIASRKDVKVVLLAGPSSSGKTTTCKRLSIQLLTNGIKPLQISLDDYFVNREDTPRDESGEYDYESIYALNIPLINEQFSKLFNGEEVELPKYNFQTGIRWYASTRTQDVPSRPDFLYA